MRIHHAGVTQARFYLISPDLEWNMYRLYWAPDNASLIIRILMEELEVPFKAVAVDRSVREQESLEYRALNPAGQIPACIIDGKAVFETAAIGMTICERENRMMPAVGSTDRTSFLKWQFFLSNSLHTDLRQLFYPEKYVSGEIEAFREVTLDRLKQRITIMEAAYKKSANLYLFGEEPSLIDIYLAVCLRWTRLYPVDALHRPDLSAYPAVFKMLTAIQERPSVARASAAEGIHAPFITRPTPPDGSKGVAL